MDGSFDKLTPENHVVEDTDDGGAKIVMELPPEPAPTSNFYDNLLADKAFEEAIKRLALDVFEKVKQDDDTRSSQNKKHEDNLKRTGLTSDIIGGAVFDGAAKVVHPIILEAGIDYSARVVQEHFPMSGPVRQQVDGLDERRIERAGRVVKWMNWQLTEVCREFREEIEKGISQQPYSAGYYVKTFWGDDENRPSFESISIDDIILPPNATSFNNTHRKAHRVRLIQDEFEERVKSKMYVADSAKMAAPSMSPEQTGPKNAADQMSGQEQNVENLDGDRVLYDVYLFCRIPEISKHRTYYLLTIDAEDGTPYALYRNHEEDDPRAEIEKIVEFPFMRLRGAYPASLGDILASIGSAATGALRALLDTAHIANSTGGARLKALAGGSGKTHTVSPTEVFEIDATGTDDIRKAWMPFETKQPSPILFQLLGFLTEMGRGVVRTSMEDTSNSNTPTPVGTQMSRVEEGTRTFKSIFQRQFVAMSRLLRIVYNLNRKHLTDELILKQAGQQLVKAEDFTGSYDILPTADPNVYTEAQRFSQVQGLAARATNNPLYNPVEVEKTVLRQLRYTEADMSRLLVQPPKPQEMNAVNENMSMMIGRPVVAFPAQHHLAHIQAHLAFMEDPIFGASPISVTRLIPAMLEHIKQHLGFWYVSAVVEQVEQVAPELGIKELMTVQDPAAKAKVDVLVAAAASKVHARAQSDLKFIPEVIQKSIQLLSQYAPKPPMDPGQIQLKAIEADTKKEELRLADKKEDRAVRTDQKMQEMEQEAKASRDKMALQLKELSDALTSTREMAKQEYAAQSAQLEKEFKESMVRFQTDLAKAREDNAFALQIAMLSNNAKTAKAEKSDGSTSAEPAPAPDIGPLGSVVSQVVQDILAKTKPPPRRQKMTHKIDPTTGDVLETYLEEISE